MCVLYTRLIRPLVYGGNELRIAYFLYDFRLQQRLNIKLIKNDLKTF